ncbi:MAG TPA: TlpA disulfide reductase family protein [Candidatus Babeliales bacterium]|nr:TlpA disulfide reductase family protein [Candidatus Babeliales bacterium]
MDRLEFLSALAAALAGAAPVPSPSPSPTTSSNPWDECTTSGALPYDRPIGLKMRVLDGPDFDLIKYRGQAVLLHIFATWCGPCNKEMPYVVEAAADYAPHGLAVIGIDSREQDNTVRAFRKRYGIAFPIAMDADGTFVQVLEVGMKHGTVNFPVTLFIDPDGYLYCDLVGGVSRGQLRYRIERFLTASAGALKPAASPTPMPASPRPARITEPVLGDLAPGLFPG